MIGKSRLHRFGFAFAVALLTIASVAISARTALASGKIYFGSRVGMTVSVISVQGLNTSNAVIHTKHTRHDAIAFCRDYEQNLTNDCVNRELETPMNDYIAANCSTGVFIDFFGNRYHFEGQRRRPTSDLSKYTIRDLSTGEIEDGTSAAAIRPIWHFPYSLHNACSGYLTVSGSRRRRIHQRRSAWGAVEEAILTVIASTYCSFGA